jgi:hypothetical protein
VSRRALCALQLLALGVGVLAFALARSGDGDQVLTKSEYEQKVRSAYADVQDAFRSTNVRSMQELAARVADAQAHLRRAASSLDEIQPPGAIEKQNDQLVAGMREYADDLDELRRAAEEGDSAAVSQFNTGIPQNAAVRKMAEAAEEMKFEGYDLGRIAED